MPKPIYVTQPSLPPLEEYIEALKQVWETGIMTHCGPLMQQLETEVTSYLKSSATICVSSGTSALQLALKALEIKGEVITTPFTFIATANIIKWENCTPVFVDIEEDTWNINPDLIEEAITEKTTAIMPVHVFSNPCNINKIEKIAKKYNLKTIYDSAHAMCVKYNGQSIMSYGDISCTSFHATKIFNTCEGGACFTSDIKLEKKIRQMRFFGFDEDKNIASVGMNAKMTEIHAALGLTNLKYLDRVTQDRRAKYHYYKDSLKSVNFIKYQSINPNEYNFSYMPILVHKKINPKLIKILNKHNIFPKKYFNPSLNHIPLFNQNKTLPISNQVQGNVICLPIYWKLKYSEIDRITELIKSI